MWFWIRTHCKTHVNRLIKLDAHSSCTHSSSWTINFSHSCSLSLSLSTHRFFYFTPTFISEVIVVYMLLNQATFTLFSRFLFVFHLKITNFWSPQPTIIFLFWNCSFPKLNTTFVSCLFHPSFVTHIDHDLNWN